MIDANSQFFAILTNVGMVKQANADALGVPWNITDMGVGDANGTDPIPNSAQTKLINEWRRRPLNQLKVDPVNPAVIIAEQIIPADEGGRWIREIGLYDADGDLIAVANCAPSFKPVLSQGSGRTQIVRMNLVVTSAGNIQLKIDPAIVLASRAYVDAAILEVLPKNKTPGEYTRVKVNDRGVVVSGDNPDTLAKMGIKDSYTKAEIESMIAQASALPVGATVAFPLDKVAPGFLELDGSVKSIAVYPDLAAFLGTAFNKGDEGAGNFRLPESRGEFLRGWDHGRGVDPERGVGSSQSDALRDHYHAVLSSEAGSIAAPVSGNVVGSATNNLNATYRAAGTSVLPATTTSLVQGPVAARFGPETRPRNLAVIWCIKAWNAPINQGNIDIAALAALSTQATEIKLGTAKIATQAQTNAGTDDATIVTPKKLRLGFSISLGMSGSVVFPTWLGGIIIQWLTIGTTGQVSQGFAESIASSWPLAFPNSCWFALAGIDQSNIGNGFATCRVDGFNKTTINTSTYAHITGWVGRRILAIGN
ncbi:phage-related tail fiber protein [Pseudomonas brassicacearum]|uniref:Phage-related tail fiber protein n=1 Tax=Pseudomonas brassicacearum TaxID=930166 RepID=A0AAW8M4P4_9PSED|nr:phage tail protein [Pseudomonas brassicacearum]MDR6956599.1 phage-related tail fiber protein [Pseudomonas brassicacearum]